MGVRVPVQQHDSHVFGHQNKNGKDCINRCLMLALQNIISHSLKQEEQQGQKRRLFDLIWGSHLVINMASACRLTLKCEIQDEAAALN